MSNNGRLRVLFLSQPFLFPMDTGGKIRTGKLLEKLKDLVDLTLISNFDPVKDARHLNEMKELCREYHPVPRRNIKKYSLRFYLNLLWRIFSKYPITVATDYSKELEAKVLDLARQARYDLLICDFLQPSLNFRKVKRYPTILFEHNIESVIPKRHFENARNTILKCFWWLQWQKMQRYERDTCRKFNGVITVSEADKQNLMAHFDAGNVYAIPTGIDTGYFSPREDKVKPSSIVFTGSMDWLPNEDAILFFVRDILPLIKREIPDVTFTVVGRNPSRYLVSELKSHPEVTVTGWVSDVRPYMSSHMLYVIPLRIGGGTRIKAYEAMAMGRAMVATSIGVEGLPVCDGEHLAIADDPAEFACRVVRLLRDAEARRRLEINARSFVQNNFSWDATAASFEGICRQVVEADSGQQCRI